MAKIDIEVFTNEIEKTYTILKQNLIMIDTIKELIAQGNLSEDAIASLKTSREIIYAMLSGLETAIDNTNATIENMNKVMLTDKNVKTFFGNKSIVKDPSNPQDNNIDLYVHYLEIITLQHRYFGIAYSSLKTSATGAGQGLTTLFKAPTGSARDYIMLSDINNNRVAQLKWSGSIWQILNDGALENVANITDRVETI